MKRAALALLSLGLAACSSEPQRPPKAGRVEVVGYSGLDRNGTFRFDADRPPILALTHQRFRSACARVGEECAPLVARTESVRGDRTLVWLRAVPTAGAGALVVTTDGGETTFGAVWEATPDWTKTFDDLVERGDFDGALAHLDGLPPRPAEREQRASKRAWLLGNTLRRRDEAVAVLDAASRRLASAGRFSEAASRRLTIAHYRLQQGRLTDAAAAIDQARTVLGEHADPLNAPLLLYQRSRLDRRLSRYGLATEQMERSKQLAWANGADELVAGMREVDALFLADQGRYAEALALFAQLDAPEKPAARWLRALNVAWSTVEAMRGCAHPRDFARVSRTFADLASRATSRSAKSRANAWINAAYAAWLGGDLARARDHLQTARTVHPDGGFAPHFTGWLDARLRLDSNDVAAAERAFRALADAARASSGETDGEYVLRALHGLGAARLALGDPDGALTHWRAAVAMLLRLGERSALLGGRSAYHSARDLLLNDLLALLLERGQLADALRLADRARAPVLHDLAASAPLDELTGDALRTWTRLTRQYTDARNRARAARNRCRTLPAAEVAACKTEATALQAQADKQLEERYAWVARHRPAATDHLPALPAGHALLATLPLKSGQTCAVTWEGLLLANGALTRVDLSALAADPTRLLGFEHLYVVDAGQSPARALPEWPVGDAILAERLGISFIPRASWLNQPQRAVGSRRVAIADPELDLPHSRRTGRAVPADTRLIGPAATRDAVLAQITDVAWLHFDGHGDLGNGRPGDAHLRLAQDGRLTLHDILVRRPRIGTAVLSGCEVGKSVALSAAEGVGLAEGFLLGGTDRVLAPNRVIPDVEAARFLERFYAEGGMKDPARALMTATAKLRAQGDGAWKGWRLFGRR